MNNIKTGDIVVLGKGAIVQLPPCLTSKEDCSILFKKGAIGKVIGLSDKLTIEFIVCYGVVIRIDVSWSDVQNADDEQVACYHRCYSNLET